MTEELAAGGTVRYEYLGLGLVWDYRPWLGSRHGGRRWGAAWNPRLDDNGALDRCEGFATKRDALTWLRKRAGRD